MEGSYGERTIGRGIGRGRPLGGQVAQEEPENQERHCKDGNHKQPLAKFVPAA